MRNLVTLEARGANLEGEREITIRDLIRTALRMRPDRIIVGEVRGAEAIDMLQAMNTGHDGSLSTGHANSPRDMLSRLETMVLMGMELPLMAIRRQISSGVDPVSYTHLDRLATVLYNLVESISIGACLLEPFMPETAEKILAQLGAKKRSLEVMNMFGLYQSGTKVADKPEILFARLDVNDVLAKVEEKKAAEAAGSTAGTAGNTEGAAGAGSDGADSGKAVIDIEPKAEITFEDFAKLQFQVGEIIACEAVKKAKKLLCAQVRIGSQVKHIVSGIKAHYLSLIHI